MTHCNTWYILKLSMLRYLLKSSQLLIAYCGCQDVIASNLAIILLCVTCIELYSTGLFALIQCKHTSRALFLRNLVSGYKCGRVSQTDVGPGSPSRDAANWLPSRFSLSVETRWRYGWLRMVFLKCAPLPSSNLVPFGRCGGTRETGSTVAETLVALFYRVGTHQIRRRRRAARSLESQGSAEPLCARIKGANWEVFEGKADA